MIIEKIVYDYLKENMNIPVYMERKDTPPKTYLLLEKTSGGKENMIEYATITVQSYAPSMFKAAQLNDELCDCMERITTVDKVMSCHLNNSYNYTDTITREYRYQAVFNIRML